MISPMVAMLTVHDTPELHSRVTPVTIMSMSVQGGHAIASTSGPEPVPLIITFLGIAAGIVVAGGVSRYKHRFMVKPAGQKSHGKKSRVFFSYIDTRKDTGIAPGDWPGATNVVAPVSTFEDSGRDIPRVIAIDTAPEIPIVDVDPVVPAYMQGITVGRFSSSLQRKLRELDLPGEIQDEVIAYLKELPPDVREQYLDDAFKDIVPFDPAI